MNPIDELRAVIEENFPDYWPAVDLCLATCATLLLADNVNPTAVVLVGAPATGKTTVASMFEDAVVRSVGGELVKLVYRSDNFTPAAFVSQASNRTAAELSKIDLLPKIKDKVLLTPELAPIFRGKDDELAESFSRLTRVLDGQGYTSDTGTHGQRGYVGRYIFAWIGCTTPFAPGVWRVMSQLGSRLFFLLMDTEQETTIDDLLKDPGKSYVERCRECKEAVHALLLTLFEKHGGIASVSWDPKRDDPRSRLWLARCAALLARMRTIPKEEHDRAPGERITYLPVAPEGPYRALTVLTNVARGHALVHGRSMVTLVDLPLVARVTLSSMPTDAGRILRALVDSGTLTTEQVKRAIGARSPETARRQMAYLHALGVARFDEPGMGKAATLSFLPEWDWCASSEFRALLEGEPVSAEGVCV